MKKNDLDRIRSYWNYRAGAFNGTDIPTPKNNSFLRELSDRGIIAGGGMAIDIGCGTGNYTIALAERFDFAVGCDISDNMIDYAKKRKAVSGAENVEFRRLAWQDADIREYGWEKNFDLAIAHLSPAVDSVDTLEKMRMVSRGWCAITKTVSRKSPIRQKVNEIYGLARDEFGQSQMLDFLDYLWNEGITPGIFYEREVWETALTYDEAARQYIKTLSLEYGTDRNAADKTREYFKTIAENGIVREKTDVIICTIYWNEKTHKNLLRILLTSHICMV